MTTAAAIAHFRSHMPPRIRGRYIRLRRRLGMRRYASVVIRLCERV